MFIIKILFSTITKSCQNNQITITFFSNIFTYLLLILTYVKNNFSDVIVLVNDGILVNDRIRSVHMLNDEC